MKTRHVLVGCGIALLIVVVGAVALVYWAGRAIKQATGRMAPPPQVRRAAVNKGSVLLSKSVFVSDPRLGSVTQIVYGKFDRRRGVEIGIAGTSGAAFVNEKASIKAFTPFSDMLDMVNFIDVENDGNCEFLNRGSWAVPAKLVDHSGKVLWNSDTKSGVDDAAPGDINGDGKLEFAVGYNGGGGVSLVNSKGKELWNRSDGNVWHVEMVDTNNDGRLEIVNSNAGGQITVRTARGDIMGQASPAEYFSHFSLCRWPTDTAPIRCVSLSDGAVWLFDFDGTTAARFAAPNCRELGDAYGTMVRLQAAKPEYLAVIASYNNWNRSILWLFDSRKALAYEEIIPEPCQSITALQLNKSPTQSILVGGEGKVWRYDLSKRKP